MAQDASTIPPKGLGQIDFRDLAKSAILAAITNLLLSIYPIINSGNWPTHADFIVMVKSTVALMIAYLIKNIGTNNAGQFLKKDKEIIKVDAEAVEKLVDQQKKP